MMGSKTGFRDEASHIPESLLHKFGPKTSSGLYRQEIWVAVWFVYPLRLADEKYSYSCIRTGQEIPPRSLSEEQHLQDIPAMDTGTPNDPHPG